MTWTDTSVPTLLAASDPASVAAFTAPTSPLMMTATRPSPTCSRPTMMTFAALTMASAAASAATKPLVSIMPIALDMGVSVLWLELVGLLLLRLLAGLVQRADDERVDRDLSAAEPGRRGGTGHHHDLFAFAAAQHVECHDAAAAFGLDFQERAGGDVLDALGGPVPADHVTAYHGLVLSKVRPRVRARSLARGVTGTPGASRILES